VYDKTYLVEADSGVYAFDGLGVVVESLRLGDIVEQHPLNQEEVLRRTLAEYVVQKT
jgi:hypothetical protein